MDRKLLPSRSTMSLLHRFSDGALHTLLLLAVMAIVALTLVQAYNTGVAVWRLEPVIIHGQSLPAQR